MAPNDTTTSLAKRFPNIQRWIESGGHVELGSDGYLFSGGRLMRRDKLVGETSDGYYTLDQALEDLERLAIAHYRSQDGGRT